MNKYESYLRQKPPTMHNSLERTYLNIQDGSKLNLTNKAIKEVDTDIFQKGALSDSQMYGKIISGAADDFMDQKAFKGYKEAAQKAKANGENLSYSSSLSSSTAATIEPIYDVVNGLFNAGIGIVVPNIGGQRAGAQEFKAPSKTQLFLGEVISGIEQFESGVGELQEGVTKPLDWIQQSTENDINWGLSDQVNNLNKARIGEAIVELASAPVGGVLAKAGVKGLSAASKATKHAAVGLGKAMSKMPSKVAEKLVNKFGVDSSYVKGFIKKHGDDFKVTKEGNLVGKDGKTPVTPGRFKAHTELSQLDDIAADARKSVATADTPQSAQKAQRALMQVEAVQESRIRKNPDDLVQKIEVSAVRQGIQKLSDKINAGFNKLGDITSKQFMSDPNTQRLSQLVKSVGENPKEFIKKISFNGVIDKKRMSSEISRITQKAGEQMANQFEALQNRAYKANPKGAYDFIYKKYGSYSAGDIVKDLEGSLSGASTKFGEFIKTAKRVFDKPVSNVGQAHYDAVMKFGGFFDDSQLKDFVSSMGTDKYKAKAMEMYQKIGNSSMAKAFENGVSQTIAGKIADGGTRASNIVESTKDILANIYKTKNAKAKAAASVIKEKGAEMGEAAQKFYTTVANKVVMGKNDLDSLSAATIRENLERMANNIRGNIASMPSGTPAGLREGTAKVMNAFGRATTKLYVQIQKGDVKKMVKAHLAKIQEKLPTKDGDGDGAIESAMQQMKSTAIDDIIVSMAEETIGTMVGKATKKLPDSLKKEMQQIVRPFMEETLEEVKDFGRAMLGDGTIDQVYGDKVLPKAKKKAPANGLALQNELNNQAKRDKDFGDIHNNPKRSAADELNETDEKGAADGFLSEDDKSVANSLGKYSGSSAQGRVSKKTFDSFKKKTTKSIMAKAKEIEGVGSKARTAKEAAKKLAKNQKEVLKEANNFEKSTGTRKKLIATNKLYTKKIQTEKAAAYKRFGQIFRDEYNRAINKDGVTKVLGNSEPSPHSLKKIEK